MSKKRYSTDQVLPMALYLDVDGVLRKWNDAAISVLREFWHIPEEDLEPHKKPDQFEWVEEIESKYPFVGTALFDPSYSSFSLHMRAKAYPFASDMYHFLKSRFRSLYILTSQPNDFCSAMTKHWLEKNIEDFDSPVIISPGSRKHLVVGTNVLIDDKERTNERVRDNNGIPICMDRSWNTGWRGPRISDNRNVYHCNHWSEITDLVESYLDGRFEFKKENSDSAKAYRKNSKTALV